MEATIDRSPSSPAKVIPLSETTSSCFSRAGQVQTHPTRLVDRIAELEMIEHLVVGEEVRLVTLTGPSGVGKTRLAREVGAQTADHFTQGVCFIDLSTIRDPELVPAAIAHGLGLMDVRGDPILDRLREYLQDRHTLLILDNFEQILSAASFVVDLLTHCPNLTLLITSREALHVLWEYSVQVKPLPVPDPDHLPPLEEFLQTPSVALFLDRVRAIDPGFVLTEDNAAVVAELCTHLDGLPLALELAAARMKLLTPGMMVERLHQRFSLLRWQAQDRPLRQQTLHAAIAWSYDLLSEAERRLFRHLGVFVGAFELEAVESVEACLADGSPDVLEGLGMLVDRSLVLTEPAPGHRTQYRVLESVREYALEQLKLSGEWDTVRDAHAGYFLELAEQAALEVARAGQGDWFSRIERDHANVRTALTWLEESDQTELQLRLATALWYFWWTRGYVAEGRRHLEMALVRDSQTPPTIRARALNALGIHLLTQGDLELARQVLDEALELARSSDDLPSVVQSLTGLGLLAQRRRAWEESARWLEEARGYARGLEDASGRTYALVHLGITTLFEGDEEGAEHLLREAETAFTGLSDLRNAVTTRAWLAYLAGKRGDIAHATELLQTCFEFGTQARDTRVVFHCTNITLWLMAGMGEAEAVARLLGVQRALLQRTGFTPGKWSQNCSSDAAALVQSRLAPAAFERAVAAGRVLTDEQVAGLATELLTIQAEDRSQAEAHAERPRDSVLSDREHEVLHLVAEGLSNKLIGKQLFISPNTVSYHVTSIFNKLGVDTRAQAVAVAGQRSLL